MHNLLPQDYKKEIRREYRLRWIIVLLMFSALTGIVAIVALVPSFILSQTKYSSINGQREAVTSTLQVQNEKETIALLESAKRKADLISESSKNTSLIKALELLVAHKRSDVRIIEIRFGVLAGDGRPVTLIGTADSREALVAFSRSLQNDDALSSVALPVSNLAERTDIDFSLNVKAKF